VFNKQPWKENKCPYEKPLEPRPLRIGHNKLKYTQEYLDERYKDDDNQTKKVEEVLLQYQNKDWFFKPDLHGFYRIEELLPLEYDLGQVKTKHGNYPGWWTGKEWASRRKLKDDPVIAWRRHDQPDDFVLDEESD